MEDQINFESRIDFTDLNEKITQIRERMGKVDGTVMQRVDAAIAVSFGLSNSRLV